MRTHGSDAVDRPVRFRRAVAFGSNRPARNTNIPASESALNGVSRTISPEPSLGGAGSWRRGRDGFARDRQWFRGAVVRGARCGLVRGGLQDRVALVGDGAGHHRVRRFSASTAPAPGGRVRRLGCAAVSVLRSRSAVFSVRGNAASPGSASTLESIRTFTPTPPQDCFGPDREHHAATFGLAHCRVSLRILTLRSPNWSRLRPLFSPPCWGCARPHLWASRLSGGGGGDGPIR